MLANPENKYQPFTLPVDMSDRTWPSKRIDTPPRWCSVDMRDGNQSLIDPMGMEKKLRFFNLLIESGFKEIEIGFPSASQTEFDFVRHLIEENLIPEDITVQVLTQSREDLIRRTFESLKGVNRAIVHLYNATAPEFRRVVFQMEKGEIIDLAVKGAHIMLEEAAAQPDTNWTFQYSPETFSMTEPDFALEICEAVLEVWKPTPDKSGNYQPAGHRRSDDTERLCRSGGVVLPQYLAARCAFHLRSSAQ